MRAGYIYFAETSSGHIKVGRSYSHVTVAQKEAMYRRLDPGFIIRHAYECADVVVEEKRVLNMLRLVAGTEVKGAGRECFAMSVKDAVAAVSAGPSAEADLARKMVLDFNIAGATIGQLIRAADAPAKPGDDELAAVRTFTTNMLKLNKLGIMLVKNGHELGLAADSYATVVDGKLLARRIPQLKKLPVELNGLALY